MNESIFIGTIGLNKQKQKSCFVMEKIVEHALTKKYK